MILLKFTVEFNKEIAAKKDRKNSAYLNNVTPLSPSTQIEHFLLIKDEHFLFGKDSLLMF